MREPPDRLTERVLQMLNAARTSPMTRDEVMERLMLSLRRNLSYVVRKNQRTPSVEALESDLEAIAHAIVLARTAERFASRASQEGRLIAMHPSSLHPLFAGCPKMGKLSVQHREHSLCHTRPAAGILEIVWSNGSHRFTARTGEHACLYWSLPSSLASVAHVKTHQSTT